MKSAFVAIGAACLLSACSANPVERAEVGFGMGAATGCAMGAAATVWSGPGALLGCGIGAAMGAAAGTSMGVATAPVPPPSPPIVSPYSYP